MENPWPHGVMGTMTWGGFHVASIWLLVSDGVRGDVEENIFLSSGGDGDRPMTPENEGMFPGSREQFKV